MARTSGGPNAGAGSPETTKVADPKASLAKTNGHGAATKPHVNGNGNGHTNGNGHGNGHGLDAKTLLLERTEIDLGGRLKVRSEQFASFQADAPSCDNCGAITVRNGNCYLCHNCGNSMGCS